MHSNSTHHIALEESFSCQYYGKTAPRLLPPDYNPQTMAPGLLPPDYCPQTTASRLLPPDYGQDYGPQTTAPRLWPHLSPHVCATSVLLCDWVPATTATPWCAQGGRGGGRNLATRPFLGDRPCGGVIYGRSQTSYQTSGRDQSEGSHCLGHWGCLSERQCKDTLTRLQVSDMAPTLDFT